VAGLAILSLVYGNFAPLLEPFPAWLPWASVWAYAAGAILLAASAGLFFARSALVSALVIGGYGLVWVLTRVRPVFLKPRNVGSWYGLSEALGALIGAWLLSALLRRQQGLGGARPPGALAPTASGSELNRLGSPSVAPPVTTMTGDRSLHVARVLFGAACVVYGAGHFAYAAYTAAMVPAWLPGRTGLAYLTGAAHAAAGLSLLVGILPRLAATLEAIMISLFGVLVWLPSFFAQPRPEWAAPLQVQWSETLLTFLLAASACIVAASLRNTPPIGISPSNRRC